MNTGLYTSVTISFIKPESLEIFLKDCQRVYLPHSCGGGRLFRSLGAAQWNALLQMVFRLNDGSMSKWLLADLSDLAGW